MPPPCEPDLPTSPLHTKCFTYRRSGLRQVTGCFPSFGSRHALSLLFVAWEGLGALGKTLGLVQRALGSSGRGLWELLGSLLGRSWNLLWRPWALLGRS